MDMNKKPMHVVRCGNIRAACWLNQSEAGNFYNTKITSIYRDKESEEWSDSSSFSERDLLAVAYVAQEMCRWVCNRKQMGVDGGVISFGPPMSDA